MVLLAALLVRSFVLATPYLVSVTVDLHDLSVLAAGDRLATVGGVLDPSYIETFWDENHDGIEQPTETARSWSYFLGTPDRKTGVRLESRHDPDEMFANGGAVTVTGRLSAGSGSGDLPFSPEVPDFGPKDLTFPLSGAWLYQDDVFAETARLPDAVVVFLLPAVLLVIAVVVGYAPFRRAPSRIDRAAALPTAPSRAYVTGVVDLGRGPERVRDLEVVVAAREDTFGRRSVAIVQPADRRQVAVLTTASQLEPGEVATLSDVRWAVRERASGLVVGFESASDRDGFAGSVVA